MKSKKFEPKSFRSREVLQLCFRSSFYRSRLKKIKNMNLKIKTKFTYPKQFEMEKVIN